MQEQLEFAVGVAKDAGKTILEYFDGEQEVEFKHDNSPVTIADKQINEFVIQQIANKYPNHGVLGEEASTDRVDQEYVWFCDPIDGTKAFTWGLPTAVFSLALITKGRPALGVVYDPFLDYTYTAVDGQGSFRNDERLAVSDLDLESGIFGGTGEHRKLSSEFFKELGERGVHLAFFSGYVYKCCLVARGRITGVVEAAVGPHDIAAAELIVSEAGGRVTSMTGEELDYSKPFKGAIVSNGVVHDELVRMAQKF